MKYLSNPRFLAIYSGVLTLLFTATLLCGFAMARNASFGVLTARRINIVEPDGTVRMTISNRADFPGAWRRGKEEPRPDRKDAAGMLFMNEEGTELGCFIFGAQQLPDGTIQNHGHFSLDQYEDNQVFAFDAGQEGKEKFSRISIVDQGDYPVEEKRDAVARIGKLPESERRAAWKQFFATHKHDVKRMELGRSPDGSSSLVLRDGLGRKRIVLAVQSDGRPALQFLDETGKVVSQLEDLNHMH